MRGYEDSREDLKRLFCEVELVLMPSRTEGFGLTGLESLSAGLPVLVSKNSGFGEALGIYLSLSLKIPVHGQQLSKPSGKKTESYNLMRLRLCVVSMLKDKLV